MGWRTKDYYSNNDFLCLLFLLQWLILLYYDFIKWKLKYLNHHTGKDPEITAISTCFFFNLFGSDFQVKIAKAKCEKLKTPQKLLSYQHIDVHPTNHITNSCDQKRQKVKRPWVFSRFLIFKMWILAIFFLYKTSFELNDVERLGIFL